MSSEADLMIISQELMKLNDNLCSINDTLQTQEQELKKISASFSLLTYLLQFNLGVNVNNTSLYNMSKYLKEINDKI